MDIQKNYMKYVKVNEIKQKITRELDEEFFEDLGMEGIDTKEALEKQVKENITAGKEAELENKYTEDLLAEVAKTTEIDVPDTMINDETERMVEQFSQHISMQGISIEQFYQYTNSNKEALKEQYKEEALKRIKYRLIIESIIKAEKIEITDEDKKQLESLPVEIKAKAGANGKLFGSVTAKEIAESIQNFFPDTKLEQLTVSIQKYKDIDAWNEDLRMQPEAFDRLQTVIQEAGELKENVDFQTIVDNTWAEKAAE